MTRMIWQTCIVYFLHPGVRCQKFCNLLCIFLHTYVNEIILHSSGMLLKKDMNGIHSSAPSPLTCCFSTRKAMVLIPRRQSQQSNGANPAPSAFCRKYIRFAKLLYIHSQRKVGHGLLRKVKVLFNAMKQPSGHTYHL